MKPTFYLSRLVATVSAGRCLTLLSCVHASELSRYLSSEGWKKSVTFGLHHSRVYTTACDTVDFCSPTSRRIFNYCQWPHLHWAPRCFGSKASNDKSVV